MEQFNLYVHGVPIGHEICGSNKEREYIKTFYNHDHKVEVSTLVQIDIVNDTSFYTYLREKNVYNAEGRPGSYFGLTVSFANRLCSNVQMLYYILDAIFNQICLGRLIESKNGTDKFLVREISKCSYNGIAIVDYIKSAFEKYIESLRFEALKDYTNSKDEAKFSLEEVDSPLFRETLLKSHILVSAEYQTTKTANKNLSEQLTSTQTQKVKLESENKQLKENNDKLSKYVESLKEELSSSKTHHKPKPDVLPSQEEQHGEGVSARDTTIKEISEIVNKIKKPLTDLTRLLAGGFPEKNKKHSSKTIDFFPADIDSYKEKNGLQ